jgi:hypothetical protein
VLETLAEPIARFGSAFGHMLGAAEMALHGAVEVAIFKGEMDAENITVTYGKNSDSRIMHAYDFSRPKGNKVGWATSSTPLYFTLHNRWLSKRGARSWMS